MIFKRLAFYTFLQFIFLLGLKVWFFNYPLLASPSLNGIIFWLLVGVVTAALIRRFGVISYVEALIAIFLWIVGDIILDYAFSGIYRVSVFASASYWIGLLVLFISAFFFHKKRHVFIRHQLHAHHHGHGDHASHEHENHKDHKTTGH